MTIIQMSLCSSILILAVIVIRRLMLYRLPKKTFLVLWGIVIFKLLIPFSIPSELSIFTFTDRIDLFTSNKILSTISTIEIIPIQNIVSLLLIIWSLGMIMGGLFFIATHLRCRHKYEMALPVDNKVITKFRLESKLKRPIQIKQSDMIATPLTYGVLRPVILLSKTIDYTDERQLKYVLSHEFTHIRQFDIVAKWLLALTLCIHWFNPLVWIMYILANRDIELSCDETVLLKFGESGKSAYALTLIALEEKLSGLNPLCSNFSKNIIEERMIAIMKMKNISKWSILTATILVSLTTAVFATTSISKTSISSTTDISVPDLIGKTYEESISTLQESGIDFIIE